MWNAEFGSISAGQWGPQNRVVRIMNKTNDGVLKSAYVCKRVGITIFANSTTLPLYGPPSQFAFSFHISDPSLCDGPRNSSSIRACANSGYPVLHTLGKRRICLPRFPCP
eukprot:GHVO01034418.1.p1 GENE.GHVO01034418.1~~GHVO01034418.1.p1  ORF type:complete len:110 (+),score=6.58 GHVO01034418.1:97-426(+)